MDKCTPKSRWLGAPEPTLHRTTTTRHVLSYSLFSDSWSPPRWWPWS